MTRYIWKATEANPNSQNPLLALLENFGSRGCVAARMKVLHGPLHSELCLYDSV